MQSWRLVLRPPAVVPGIASSPLGRSTLGVRPAARRRLVAVAALLGSALPASLAWAHAVPATMDPAPNARLDVSPREVVIRFTERVEARPSTLEVLDAGGRRVDLGGAAVDPADPWRYRVGLPSLPAAPTPCPGACCRPTTATSPAAPTSSRSARLFAGGGGGGIRIHGPERSGSGGRSRDGWSGWAERFSWALLSPARLLGLGGVRWTGGMEVLGGMAVAVGGTLDLVLQARDACRADARWSACWRRSSARRPASCGSLEAGSSCCSACCPHRARRAAARTRGAGGFGSPWPPRS